MTKITGLDKLSYYQNIPADGRAIVLSWFLENGEFYLPFQDGNEIVILKPIPIDPLKTTYLAKKPADPDIDLHIPLVELLVQQLSFPRVVGIIPSIVSDILNFGAILEKYELIFRSSRESSTDLIATELEFLFYNVRSLYDQLQFIIKNIWDKTTLSDKQIKGQQLDDSFGKVVLSGQQIRSAEEIAAKYGLLRPIARFYEEQGSFFKLCRAVRDNMAHRGKSFSDQPIYCLSGGFAVDVKMYPYSEFDYWTVELLRNKNLGSVRALIAYIGNQAIQATSSYVDALRSCATLPDPIGPDWHVYVRHPHAAHLHHLETYINTPWMDEAGQSQ
jgi:hypothetical protein